MKPAERTAKLFKAIFLLAISMILNLTGYLVSGGQATPAAGVFVGLGLITLFVGEFVGFETFFNKKMELE